MSIIIADSGSTKTDWIIVNSISDYNTVKTIGFNPYYYSSDQIGNEIRSKLYPLIKDLDIQEIYFYGSGISTPNKVLKTTKALQKFFPNTKIEVEHDLLAAARGLFQKEAGIACILGTGSNSCIYDGNSITHNIPSLGYFFADEGSGTHIGKLFIEDYLRDKLPHAIKYDVEEKFDLNIEKILDVIYNKENPNKFLASFSPYVSENIQEDYMIGVVKRSFRSFFETYIVNYPDFQKLPLRFMGSVALVHQNLLKDVAAAFNLEIDHVMKSPREGLIRFHTESA